MYNDAADNGGGKLGAEGALVPEGPHGNVQEVIAPNVAKEDVLFPDSVRPNTNPNPNPNPEP